MQASDAETVPSFLDLRFNLISRLNFNNTILETIRSIGRYSIGNRRADASYVREYGERPMEDTIAVQPQNNPITQTQARPCKREREFAERNGVLPVCGRRTMCTTCAIMDARLRDLQAASFPTKNG